MPKVIIPIYFDYASTLCYVAWRIVRDLEAELDFIPIWKGVPIRLRDGRIRPGHLVLLEAMGGGFTWGSALVRW